MQNPCTIYHNYGNMEPDFDTESRPVRRKGALTENINTLVGTVSTKRVATSVVLFFECLYNRQ